MKKQQQRQDVGKQRLRKREGKIVEGGVWRGGGGEQNNRLARSKAFSRAESLRRNGKSFFALEIFN